MAFLNRFLFFIMLAGLFGVTLFLLRENERAVSAEARASALSAQMERMRNEKGNAITELETSLMEKDVTLADQQAEYNRLFLEKSDEIEKLKLEAAETKERYEDFLTEKNAEIAALEKTIRDEAKKSEERLSKKNSELSEIGSQLKDVSANLSRVLKEKEVAETRIRQDERKLLDLEYALRRLELEKSQAQAAQALTPTTTSAKLAYD